jgi:hypothetical protein
MQNGQGECATVLKSRAIDDPVIYRNIDMGGAQ